MQSSPALVRALPFCLFVLLTALQGRFGEASIYWMYLLKSLIGVALILFMRPFVSEMRWRCSWEAVAVGLGVFVVWVGLDPFYPKLAASSSAWNPLKAFPEHPGLAWMFVIGRILASTLVVAPLEEVFYRSFLYRWLARPDFTSLPLHHVAWPAFLITALLFGFAHHEWLAGIVCALAYHGLVLRKKRLGDAITAHAITNFLLGLWVVWKGEWHFW
jgi:CAAX prenyl protease-like protein